MRRDGEPLSEPSVPRRVALLERLASVMNKRFSPNEGTCDCDACVLLRQLSNPTSPSVPHGTSSPSPDAERGGTEPAGSAGRASDGRSAEGGGADRVGPGVGKLAVGEMRVWNTRGVPLTLQRTDDGYVLTRASLPVKIPNDLVPHVAELLTGPPGTEDRIAHSLTARRYGDGSVWISMGVNARLDAVDAALLSTILTGGDGS